MSRMPSLPSFPNCVRSCQQSYEIMAFMYNHSIVAKTCKCKGHALLGCISMTCYDASSLPYKQDATGSSPVSPTIKNKNLRKLMMCVSWAFFVEVCHSVPSVYLVELWIVGIRVSTFAAPDVFAVVYLSVVDRLLWPRRILKRSRLTPFLCRRYGDGHEIGDLSLPVICYFVNRFYMPSSPCAKI